MLFIRAMLAALVMILAAGAGNAKDKCDPSRGVNLYSPERERELGRRMAQEVEREVHLADDSVTSEYINRLAQNLGLQAGPGVSITVRIVDSEEVNAFALPGGHPIRQHRSDSQHEERGRTRRGAGA